MRSSYDSIGSVDFTQLLLYRDIVQTRSISRGAVMNGVTQSAASQALQELERQLDVRLLDRSRRPLEVLAAGRLFYDFARDVLRRQQDFTAALDEMKGSEGGMVRIAAIYSVGISEMSKLEQEFYRRLPTAQLEVNYLRPEKVYQAVAEERVDIGLVSYPEPTREITALPWREEMMVVACSPTHAFAGRECMNPSELEGSDFIGFDEDLPISRDIERFLREHSVRVRISSRFDNIQSMKEALRLGSGVSILPEPMLHSEVQEGRLCAIRLEEPLIRPLGIIHRRRRSFPHAAQVFLDLLRTPAA
jgi:DNA-binding transcriptional LysR family regulator